MEQLRRSTKYTKQKGFVRGVSCDFADHLPTAGEKHEAETKTLSDFAVTSPTAFRMLNFD
jgi:hypothetical protein